MYGHALPLNELNFEDRIKICVYLVVIYTT